MRADKAMKKSERPSRTVSLNGPVVIVSPHADDAAYSIGGLIQKSIFRSPVHIVTLFGRSNYLRRSGFDNEPDTVSRLRYREDMSFAARVGAALTYLDFPEAALRIRSKSEGIFATDVKEPAPPNVQTTLDELFDEIRPRGVFAPLAIGQHRDHLIARDLAAGQATRAQLPLFYYEDLPYAAALTRPQLRAHTQSVDARLRAVNVPVELAAKLNGLTLYRSQIGTEELQIVSEYARRWRLDQAVERIWTASSKSEFLKMFGAGRVFETDPHHHRKAAKAVQQGGR